MIDTFSGELRTVFRLWRNEFDRELAVRGYSHTKGLALVYLTEAPEPMTQKTLANLLGIEEASMVRQIDNLEKEGMLLRKVGERDKRERYLHLTEKAAPVVEDVRRAVAAVRHKALANVPADKLVVAIEVLQMIVRNFEI